MNVGPRCAMLRAMWLRLVLTLGLFACLDTDGFSDQKAPKPPKACSQKDIQRYGRPIMFRRRDGVAFGISTLHTTVSKDGDSTVYLWLSNQSRLPQGYDVCCNVTLFKKIEVFDSAGVRLENASDVRLKDLQDKDQAYVEGCSCSAMLNIAPGSCSVVDQGSLNAKGIAYDLRPGKYTVRERSPSGSNSKLSLDSKKETDGLSITVEDH